MTIATATRRRDRAGEGERGGEGRGGVDVAQDVEGEVLRVGAQGELARGRGVDVEEAACACV